MTKNSFVVEVTFKGTLLGLRQYLANENSLKMMKNAFYFTLKALFVLNIFKFLSFKNGLIRKMDKFNFKICDVTTWETNNCNSYIDLKLTDTSLKQYLISQQKTSYFWNKAISSVFFL